LNDIQWNSSNSAASDNCDETDNNIDCKLELDEFSNVIKDSSSILDGFID